MTKEVIAPLYRVFDMTALVNHVSQVVKVAAQLDSDLDPEQSSGFFACQRIEALGPQSIVQINDVPVGQVGYWSAEVIEQSARLSEKHLGEQGHFLSGQSQDLDKGMHRGAAVCGSYVYALAGNMQPEVGEAVAVVLGFSTRVSDENHVQRLAQISQNRFVQPLLMLVKEKSLFLPARVPFAEK